MEKVVKMDRDMTKVRGKHTFTQNMKVYFHNMNICVSIYSK